MAAPENMSSPTAYGMPGRHPRSDGLRSCYCDKCHQYGYEGRRCVSFERIGVASW